MLTLVRFFVFVLALFASLFSVNASAEDYYWYIEGYPNIRYPSAKAACDQQILNRGYEFLPGYIVFMRFEFWKEDKGSCRVVWHRQDGTVIESNYGIGVMYRSGDSCPQGTEYNSQTGGCEALPPECPVGDLFPARGPDSPVINSGGRYYVATGEPPTACYNQCRYVSDNGLSSSCYLVPGSTTTGFCNYILKSNGESCPSDDYRLSESGDPLNPPDTPDVPPSDPNDPGCPSGWAWSGTTCVKTDGGDNGGDGGDGDGDGSGSGSGSGGSGSGGGDGGSGSGGGGDGSGSGGDGDGEGGGGGGIGDGAGEDEGAECDPETDPNGCVKPSVEGEGCDAELKCSGDVIQCAILRKQKEQVCSWDYDKAKNQIEQAVNSPEYELTTETINLGNSFSEGANGSRWLSSGCPSPRSFTVIGHSYSLSWEPVCNFASSLSYVIVAMAGLFFAVYVGRGLGGQ